MATIRLMIPSFESTEVTLNEYQSVMQVIKNVYIQALSSELNISFAKTMSMIFLKHGQHLGRTFTLQR